MDGERGPLPLGGLACISKGEDIVKKKRGQVERQMKLEKLSVWLPSRKSEEKKSMKILERTQEEGGAGKHWWGRWEIKAMKTRPSGVTNFRSTEKNVENASF